MKATLTKMPVYREGPTQVKRVFQTCTASTPSPIKDTAVYSGLPSSTLRAFIAAKQTWGAYGESLEEMRDRVHRMHT